MKQKRVSGPWSGEARWSGTLVDIHERKVAEIALAKSESLYRGVMEASADCIKIMSVSGRVLKIDRSFVSSIEVDCESAAIVAAVIGLGTNLSLEVVAEGVETEAQRAYLIARGCCAGQGFLFGEAIPADRVPSLFGNQAADPASARGPAAKRPD